MIAIHPRHPRFGFLFLHALTSSVAGVWLGLPGGQALPIGRQAAALSLSTILLHPRHPIFAITRIRAQPVRKIYPARAGVAGIANERRLRVKRQVGGMVCSRFCAKMSVARTRRPYSPAIRSVNNPGGGAKTLLFAPMRLLDHLRSSNWAGQIGAPLLVAGECEENREIHNFRCTSGVCDRR